MSRQAPIAAPGTPAGEPPPSHAPPSGAPTACEPLAPDILPGQGAEPDPSPTPGADLGPAPRAVPDPAAPPGPLTRHARLFDAAAARGVPLAAILTVAGVAVGVYVLAQAVYRLREVILLVAVAGFVALLLNPIVAALQRIGRFGLHRRGVAVALVTVGALVVFAGLATVFGYPLVDGVTHVASHVTTYVSQAQRGKGWIGRLVRRYHIERFVHREAPKLEAYAKDLAKPALSLGEGAATLVVALVVIFMLVVLMLLDGSKVRRGVLQLVPARHREEVLRVAHEVNRSVTGYMLGDLVTSVIAGVVVFVTMSILGLPQAPLWGLWVALVDFLPMIGGALAGIPVVLFALVAGGLADGIVLGIVFIVYTQVENHVLNPLVMSKTVRISPLLVLLAILVGAELGDLVGGVLGGFVGTLLAIPSAGAIQVIVREVWRHTSPGGPSTSSLAGGPGPTPGPAAAAGTGGVQGPVVDVNPGPVVVEGDGVGAGGASSSFT